MSEKPILFSGPMVRAILDGTKTQTRRVIKPQPVCEISGTYFDAYDGGPQWNWWTEDNRLCNGHDIIKCPYGKPGDHLWVRETLKGEMYASKCWTLEYAANGDEVLANIPDDWMPPINMITTHRERGDNVRDGGFDWWRCMVPSIFMPRWASRILLRVTNIRVERLQDIEGQHHNCVFDVCAEGLPSCQLYSENQALEWFRKLWDSINAKRGYSWESNPWVWAVTFERVNP